MATLLPSVAIRPHCVNCGATESPKLIFPAQYIIGNKAICGLEKIHMGRKTEVAQKFTKNPLRNLNFKLLATSQISVTQTEQRLTTSTEIRELQETLSYLFRTEIGGHVKVFVGKKNIKYAVYIEVSSLLRLNSDSELILSWGIFRSDSSCLMPVDFQNSALGARTGTIETPFTQKSSGIFTTDLVFEAKQTPLYLSFLLKSSLDVDSNSSEIRSHRKTNFCVPVGFGSGIPAPLGLSFRVDGSSNFAIFSRNAEGVILCLYDDAKADKPALEIDLDPYVNRSGDIWHASIEILPNFVSYGYRFRGEGDEFDTERVILDPYAKIIGNAVSDHHGSGFPVKHLGQVSREPAFDWSGDVRPNLPMEKLVVYRLNVMHFTKDKSSQLPVNVAGTFSGLTEKLHHFKDLGVNAVLLEPIFAFDEQTGPYLPCHFFSPMNLYGPTNGCVSAINSMKEMVKTMHASGIEVLLEVVFTHTVEGGALQGIDDSSYYMNEVANLGTRNALNCNYPIVQQMIVDSLRHWVIEFRVDGFCFINSSSLLRGFHGEYLSRPPLVETIAFDPLLSKTKIIADNWDPHDMAPKDIRFPHWMRWAEMNSRFCNDVRKFLKGDALLSDLATRLCGSGDIFSDRRGPAFSFNFIAKNSGLPLVDLVSFSNTKLASELSWNCGEEGPTNKKAVLERRLKQIRNYLFVLYISLGVPILNMGDECGQSYGGSLAYSDRKPFDWNALKTGFGIQTTQFISFLTSLRIRRGDLLQKRNFLKVENIDWHGSDQSQLKWDDPSSKFLAMTLKADIAESERNPMWGDLFIAINAADCSECVILPPPPEGMAWLRLVDTARPFPGFFSTNGEPVLEQTAGLYAYEMSSYSCTLFETCSPSG